MRGLIIGDFSGLGKELREGLLKNEVEVDLITSGDYWKNIKSGSIDLDYSSNNFLEKVYKGIKNRIFLRKFFKKNYKSYDFILIMNSNFINVKSLKKIFKISFSLKEIEGFSKNKKNIYLIAAGIDEYYLKNFYFFKEKYGYFFLSLDEVKILEKEYKFSVKKLNLIQNKISGIIPITYDYSISYKNYGVNKLIKTIPICLDTQKIKYENNLKGKIKLLHGISRSEQKGSSYILEAMQRVEKKYPDKVELIIVRQLKFDKYIEIIKKSNILIDQCKSCGYGMNALYGMAMGKLVLSGNEPENEKEFGEKNIPVVNIIPNVEDIEKKLEYYILNPELIISVGKRARKFVERFHDSKVVAKQYLKLFEEDLKENER